MANSNGPAPTVSNKQLGFMAGLSLAVAGVVVSMFATLDGLSRIQFLWSLRGDGFSLEKQLGPVHATTVGVAALLGCQAL